MLFTRPYYYCVIGNRYFGKLFLDVRNRDKSKQTLLLVQIKNMSSQDETPSSSSASTSKTEGKNEECNKLGSEKSPYLLQHKNNPVHWYSWGEEAFQLARAKKKPIFLSVGYSTCHWCHVMEHESFENPDVAKIMNKYFVNIKMDREERPDIDRIYMTFVQAVSGSGGWPMSVWMTSDLKPFYGGTYYPPEDRTFGRPGFKSLLLTIADQWKENSEKFTNSAEKILEVLQRTASLPFNEQLPTASDVSNRCLQQLQRSYEPAFGGFSESPKFPQPVNINFLIYYRKSNPEHGDSLKMADKTLRMMSKGGIHDHVGKGFCRYSTDKKWHVPHFEKMLYDNAQLANAYANMYLLTSDSFFARQVSDILEYVERDLSHNEGGFYSAEDADSYPSKEAKAKTEGAFYVWTKAETDKIFGSKKLSNGTTKLSEMFEWRYGIRENGNVDPGQDPHGELKRKNVLYIAHTVDETAKKFSLSGDEIRSACNEAKNMLFEYRNENRPRPGLDTKFISSWNGLMISAFARAGSALDKPSYIDRAVKAMNFVTSNLISPTGQLYRTCYRDGDDNSSPVTNLSTPILACVDDFANLINANLDLFDATWNLDYLRLAILLQKKQDEIFWDEEKGGYFNSRECPNVVVRFKDDDDGAEPSSNSTSAVNLIRLLSITDNQKYKERVTKLFKQFADRLAKVPMTLPLMTSAYEAYTAGTKLVLILKKQETKSDTVKNIRSRLLPVGSTIVGLNVDTCTSLTEWKTLVPCITEKLEHFNSRDAGEVIYLRQGQTFTHTYNKDEFESMIGAL